MNAITDALIAQAESGNVSAIKLAFELDSTRDPTLSIVAHLLSSALLTQQPD